MNRLLDIYSDYLIAQNQYATAVGLSVRCRQKVGQKIEGNK